MRLTCPILIACCLLAGCGSSTPTETLSVKCGGSTSLAGAVSIDVLADPATSSAVLSFPDPANAGRTGTIAISRGNRCTIVPLRAADRCAARLPIALAAAFLLALASCRGVGIGASASRDFSKQLGPLTTPPGHLSDGGSE